MRDGGTCRTRRPSNSVSLWRASRERRESAIRFAISNGRPQTVNALVCVCAPHEGIEIGRAAQYATALPTQQPPIPRLIDFSRHRVAGGCAIEGYCGAKYTLPGRADGGGATAGVEGAKGEKAKVLSGREHEENG